MAGSPARTPRVAIVGGGIGGMAAAAFLHKAGLFPFFAQGAAQAEQEARDESLAASDPLAASAWIYGYDPETAGERLEDPEPDARR